jgi:hypothetical protein
VTDAQKAIVARIAAKDGRYAGAAGGAKPAAAKPRPLPCVHVGEAAGPKGWHVCEHEDEPLGMIVCRCKGCGVKCPGYATANLQ